MSRCIYVERGNPMRGFGGRQGPPPVSYIRSTSRRPPAFSFPGMPQDNPVANAAFATRARAWCSGFELTVSELAQLSELERVGTPASFNRFLNRLVAQGF